MLNYPKIHTFYYTHTLAYHHYTYTSTATIVLPPATTGARHTPRTLHGSVTRGIAMRKHQMTRAHIVIAIVCTVGMLVHVCQAVVEDTIDDQQSSGVGKSLGRDGKLQDMAKNESLPEEPDNNNNNSTSGQPNTIEEFASELRLPGGQYLWSRDQLDYVSEGRRLYGFTIVNVTG